MAQFVAIINPDNDKIGSCAIGALPTWEAKGFKRVGDFTAPDGYTAESEGRKAVADTETKTKDAAKKSTAKS